MLDPDKKDRIVDAATVVFERYGFKKGSIDEIASSAGVGKGTVYLAFDSKDDLFYEVVLREARTHAARVAKQIDPRKPADEELVSCILSIWDYVSGISLLRDLYLGELDTQLPNLRDDFDELRAIGRRNLVEVLDNGVRKGLFRGDLDHHAVALALQDLMVAALLWRARGLRDEEGRNRVLLTALDLVLNGLLKAAS